ncbi:cation:dicarboxylate symporter family transporter [Ornithobacterium rhinotracheale]
MHGVDEDVGVFTVPLCSTIHLAGRTMKIVACTMALMLMQGIRFNLEMFAHFIFIL